MHARADVRLRSSSRVRGSWTPLVAGLSLVLLVVGAGGALPAPAFAQSGDTATLLWTAPGDDGNTGRATRYEMRYRTTAISGPDTLSWWNAGSAVSGLPAPSAAGATDSVVVTGLNPSLTYYFIVRAADEVFNWSGFSNVAVRGPVVVVDTTPPAAITDLSATASNSPESSPHGLPMPPAKPD